MALPVRFVIFDLDGTLVDSAPDLCSAVNHALAAVGLPIHDVEAVRRMIGEGQRVLIERAVTRAGGSISQCDAVLPLFRAYYSAHLVEKTQLYPGVQTTLAELSPRLPLAVATNKPGDWARRIASHFGLDGHLRWVLGEDDVGARKPDPRLLLSLCERAGVSPDEALMVGDSAIDRAAAQAAGMRLAFCTYGFADAETLADTQSERADAPLGSAARPWIIRDFSQIGALVG